MYQYSLMFFCFLSIQVCCQTPKGLYFKFDELISKTPKDTISIQLEKRKPSEISFMGGNDYILSKEGRVILKKFKNDTLTFVSNNEGLFINCATIGLNFGFAKISSAKKYLVFTAALPENLKESDVTKNISNYYFAAGYLFGALGSGIAGAKLAKIRLPYIINPVNQKLLLVSKINFEKIIANSPEILRKYQSDLNKDGFDTIYKYLIEWNEIQTE